MLYRTQNPFSFRFNPFSLAPPPPSASALPSPVQKAECLEGSFRRGEMEDFLVNNGQSDTAGEDFFVEDLLVDGQDVFFEEGIGGEHVNEAGDKNPSPLSVLPEPNIAQGSISTAVDDFGSVPADDVENLEWLSHFVEDSFSGYSMSCHTENIPALTAEPKPVPVQANTTMPVQTKARTKRSRTGGRVWSLTGASSSTSSSTTDSDTWLIYPGQTADSLLPPPKKRKKRVTPANAPGGSVAVPRRCGHCGVTKTPQWRAGPQGAKTLCNACGVRFKSGRLFPEYRPACSPTFSSEVHSNNHRKVLEMRRMKDAREVNNQELSS